MMFNNFAITAVGSMAGTKTFTAAELVRNWAGCLLLGAATALVILGLPILFMWLFGLLFKKEAL